MNLFFLIEKSHIKTPCIIGIIISFLMLFPIYSRAKQKGMITVSAALKVDLCDTVSYKQIGRLENGRLFIEHDIDLKGAVCSLPKGIILSANEGIIRNGTLVGNGTKIEAKAAIFDKVSIKGDWNVPIISTTLFVNLDYENSLRDVVALANPEVKNQIFIAKGEYRVRAEKNADICVELCANTDFVLNGAICLAPNEFKNYDILLVKGKNIRISGDGSIIGDKHSHKGKGGEWGMGIRFHNAINSSVSGLTIKDCWGDCIYVGGNSQDVLIEKCLLDHGRRQGISVTKADGVTIRECTITNVSGINPQYAIDIEPNRLDSVNNVLIDKVIVKDCEGGFLVTCSATSKGAKTPWIGSVIIRNCQISCLSKIPVRIMRCRNVLVEKSMIYSVGDKLAVSIVDTDKATVQNNTLNVVGSESIKRGINKALDGASINNLISIETTNQRSVRRNKIIQQ